MIVPITAENINKCVPVYLEAYNCPPWNYHWTHEKATDYLLEYTDCKHFIGFALYDGAEVVAAFFAHRKTWWTNQQLMIDEFFVARKKQGMGFGKKLLAYCNQYAADNKIESIVLMTNRYMPSYKFYDNSAYTPLEQFVFMFKQTSHY